MLVGIFYHFLMFFAISLHRSVSLLKGCFHETEPASIKKRTGWWDPQLYRFPCLCQQRCFSDVSQDDLDHWHVILICIRESPRTASCLPSCHLHRYRSGAPDPSSIFMWWIPRGALLCLPVLRPELDTFRRRISPVGSPFPPSPSSCRELEPEEVGELDTFRRRISPVGSPFPPSPSSCRELEPEEVGVMTEVFSSTIVAVSGAGA
jgi:hypothetical protein